MQSNAPGHLRLCIGIFFLFAPCISDAAPLGDTFSAADIAKLPDYCQAKMTGQGLSAEAMRWEKNYGPDKWVHMHHLCLGMIYLNRARFAFGADRANRPLYLQRAGGDFWYVINAWPKTFTLQADANFGAGQVSQLKGDNANAIGFYVKAINVRPDFVQAYVMLADLWMDLGEKAKAREVLEQGLANTANAEILVRRMARLEAGGPNSPAPNRPSSGQGSAKKP